MPNVRLTFKCELSAPVIDARNQLRLAFTYMEDYQNFKMLIQTFSHILGIISIKIFYSIYRTVRIHRFQNEKSVPKVLK